MWWAGVLVVSVGVSVCTCAEGSPLSEKVLFLSHSRDDWCRTQTLVETFPFLKRFLYCT